MVHFICQGWSKVKTRSPNIYAVAAAAAAAAAAAVVVIVYLS